MIANLERAARDNDIVRIGGGDFYPDEVADAARMLKAYPALVNQRDELLTTLQACVDLLTIGPRRGSHLHNAVLQTARNAIQRATEGAA